MKRSEIAFSFSPAGLLAAADVQAEPVFKMEIGQPQRWDNPHCGRRKPGVAGRGTPINSDFRCAQCGSPVTAAAWHSGVQNRNHCPRCLWSKHLDLHTSGDRLAACKEKMRPIGLALKQTRKKYVVAGQLTAQGELMLAHECQGCGKLSVNRIAADDDTERLLQVFQASLALDAAAHAALAGGGACLLQRADAALVRKRLFGG